MGGTFDPIHHGHLVAASEVASKFDLDEVVFVPTGRPWQKTHRRVSHSEDRYLMTVVATAANPRFTVSRVSSTTMSWTGSASNGSSWTGSSWNGSAWNGSAWVAASIPATDISGKANLSGATFTGKLATRVAAPLGSGNGSVAAGSPGDASFGLAAASGTGYLVLVISKLGLIRGFGELLALTVVVSLLVARLLVWAFLPAADKAEPTTADNEAGNDTGDDTGDDAADDMSEAPEREVLEEVR